MKSRTNESQRNTSRNRPDIGSSVQIKASSSRCSAHPLERRHEGIRNPARTSARPKEEAYYDRTPNKSPMHPSNFISVGPPVIKGPVKADSVVRPKPSQSASPESRQLGCFSLPARHKLVMQKVAKQWNQNELERRSRQ